MMLKHWKSLLLLVQLFSSFVVDADVTGQSEELEERRILQDPGSTQTDLVRLIPFAVQVALDVVQSPEETFDHLNLVFFTDLVTDWMTDSFELKAQADGLLPNTTSFSSIGLVLENQGPQTTENAGVFTAQFTGVSLWGRQGLNPVDPQLVELIQRATNLESNKLMISLQQLDGATGFGPSVLNVRAYITPKGTPTDGQAYQSPGTGDPDKNLEIIIIIAIVVACAAFGLLLFAVIWAWRTDQSKHHHHNNNQQFKSELRTPEGTGSESNFSPKHHNSSNGAGNGGANNNKLNSNKSPPHLPPAVDDRDIPSGTPSGPPSEIDGDNYPASVISEDITTALTAYYRSGNTGYGGGSLTSSGGGKNRELNDAASMSSMDSYGYSLDGYAPSLSGGPTQMGYPVGPLGPVNGQVKDPYAETDTEDEDDMLGVPPSSSPAGP